MRRVGMISLGCPKNLACEETERMLEGRLIGQAPEIDGRLLVNDGIDLLPSELPAFVEVTDAHPYDVVGAVL